MYGQTPARPQLRAKPLTLKSFHISDQAVNLARRVPVIESGGIMFATTLLSLRGLRVASRAALIAGLAVVGGRVFAAEDKYTLRVPNGLAFSDFRGYENWQVVSVSQTEDLLKVMVANPTMIDVYRAGVPGNGKPFPDGSKIAKIEWKPKKNTASPFFSEGTGRLTRRFPH